ncbi:class I SAM-dependent methyltransferase [Rhizobium sp. BE258]|uniref:class I SAM-dependent methyltransferase n=1 Tax=Rhizobium sp. BE258 TaxID=2817722 RepID=UPI0028552ABA|nr:class I SAM-dependent methyltransferase [Rhizobium sp. BE258]MDR7145342.1 2-polyprenyl-3-methyl-5-hydroxy-6-metoxy-1,4-benzoquinol methylase [Rhizobium sp. BE258]
MTHFSCRFCAAELTETVVDLGASPLANSYIDLDKTQRAEPFYSLHTYVCTQCYLVQVPPMAPREDIFDSEYAYFSSYSASVLEHARQYVEEMMDRFLFTENHQVIEVASNDGYLLKNFKARGVPVLGIEPSGNVAAVAEAAGIPSRVQFFGVETATQLVAEGIKADLLIGNNVLAHVPDINDFVGGIKKVLGPTGVVTIEFPHLMKMLDLNYYDTIYHEHYSYLSLFSAEKIFALHGMTIFDVDEIKPQGGSLRIYARHTEDSSHPLTPRVDALRSREVDGGVNSLARYKTFADQVHRTKRELLKFLFQAKEDGKTVVAYGAPAKGNTLLNFCGIKTDLIDYTVDVSPHKQNRLLPGTRIPIHAPDMIAETKPDYVLILPWNIRDEIVSQMKDVASWGGRFVVPLPEVEVLA